MNEQRLLIIECLDAAGASARDVRARADAAGAAGYEARCAIVDPDAQGAARAAASAGATLTVTPGAAGRHALLRWADSAGPGAIVVASAIPGGGGAGRWFAGAGRGAWWWPTGLADGATAPAGPLPPLPGVAGADVLAGLAGSVITDTRRAHRQLPLWDGDYVLAAVPLAGAAGAAALDGFAALCGRHDGVDLVVLSDPQPGFERMARARGVGFRVHFAGPATRDAELAWLGSASAALIAGDAPLSGGLVLRALARGCPLVAASGTAHHTTLEPWLAARGLAFGTPGEPLDARLDRAFERDAAWRGRAAAALEAHTAGAVGLRLARSVPGRRAA